MDETSKDNLIAQFRTYLDQVPEELETESGDDEFSLFAELSGLKSEVRRESRQIKEALDQFRSVFETLKANNETLSRELDQHRVVEKEQFREPLRSLLLQLLELHDRLEAGIKLNSPKPTLLGRFSRNQSRFIASLQEGQQITLRRLQRLLADYRVVPLEALDKVLDPHTMRVVEVEQRSDRDPGIVTEELRKGFFWEDELLRPAEVKVNKKDRTP